MAIKSERKKDYDRFITKYYLKSAFMICGSTRLWNALNLLLNYACEW